MPDLLVRSFAPLLLAFQSCFTQPSFHSFWAFSCAWILCCGRRSLTRIIQSAQLTGFKHYGSFHRFFSQARWNLDDLGRCVFQLLLPFCADVLVAAVDDTLARKSGRHIWGAGMHHDPLRSTQKRPFFAFGHNFGKQVKLWYQTMDALWYPSAGQQLLRIVVVRDPSGRRRDDCFFSLDLTLTATQILELFPRRWPLEVCFRDVKQFLGFEDPQNRVAKATTRTAPLIFLVYDLVLLWHAQSGHRLAEKSTPRALVVSAKSLGFL